MIGKLVGLSGAAIVGGLTLGVAFSCYYNVDPGNVAIKFSRFTGLQELHYKEGWHFLIPYFEKPIIFSI